jgi:putative FmdB family regulatory protein
MPLYEYECQACHRRTEKLRSSFSAPPETICPYCGGHLEQALSAPAVQFKGSGWYVTDYAKSGAPPKKPSDSKESGGDSSSSDKTADKPSEKSADKSSTAAPAASSKESSAPAPTQSATAPSSSSAKSE